MKRLMAVGGVIALLVGAVGVAMAPEAVHAVTVDPCAGTNVSSTLCGNSDGIEVQDAIKVIIEVLLWLVGVLAVIMIIYAGIRYTTSAGSPEAIKNAKNIIIYSVVGLVVAIFAYAIVQWVYGQFV